MSTTSWQTMLCRAVHRREFGWLTVRLDLMRMDMHRERVSAMLDGWKPGNPRHAEYLKWMQHRVMRRG